MAGGREENAELRRFLEETGERIRQVFELYQVEDSERVKLDDVGTLMRYLGAFPSEEQLQNEVKPKLASDEEQGLVGYQKFEAFVLDALVQKTYALDDEEVVLRAFEVVDEDGEGFLTEEQLREVLTSNEWAFSDEELREFFRSVKDPSSGLINYEPLTAAIFERAR